MKGRRETAGHDRHCGAWQKTCHATDDALWVSEHPRCVGVVSCRVASRCAMARTACLMEKSGVWGMDGGS